MLHDITHEKVEEVIRLAEKAHATPYERADDPKRGGSSGSAGVMRPSTPPEPQPAPDWRRAFARYLAELPDPALAELVALYRHGGGAAPGPADTAPAAILTARPDLARCLRAGLERLEATAPRARG